MTTEQELRDALHSNVGSTGTPPGWDDIRRRGHRRRQAYRAGSLAIAFVAAAGLLAVIDSVRSTPEAVLTADDPNPTTSETTATSADVVDPLAPTIEAVRGTGVFLTFVLRTPETDGGVDPCLTTSLRLSRDLDVLTVHAEHHETPTANRWVECGPNSFGMWGTVELDEAVPGLRIVDGSTGSELEVTENATLLYPRRLPPPFDIDRRTESAQTSYESLPVDGWSFEWTTGDLVLTISRWELLGDHPEGCGAAEGAREVTVAGATGQLCGDQQSSLLLSWINGEQIHIIELSDVSGNALPPHIDLVDLANQLEPLG